MTRPRPGFLLGGEPRPLPGPRFSHLHTIRLAEVSSTNSFLKERLADLAPFFPLRVEADRQTAGRGRQQRTWVAPAGLGVTVSFALAGDSPRPLPYLSLTAGVATVSAFARLGLPGTVLKWPNDVLADGRKIAGILSETVITGDRWQAILGFGLNLDQTAADFPAELAARATSFRLERGWSPGREETVEALTDALFARLETLWARGGESLVAEAEVASAPLRGRPIRFHSGSGVVSGTFAGYAADGGLLLDTPAGGRTVHHQGEILSPP